VLQVGEFLLVDPGMLSGRVENAEPPPDAPQEAQNSGHVESRFPAESVDQQPAQRVSHGDAHGVASNYYKQFKCLSPFNINSREMVIISWKC